MNSQVSAVEKNFATMTSGESDRRLIRLAGWRIYAFTLTVYLLATQVTDAFFMGDANDYVESILVHRRGYDLHFWEFGHLLWRPVGWVMAGMLQPVTSRIVGDYSRANVMLTLVWLSLAAGLMGALCLVYLLRRYCRNGVVIALTTIGFIFSQGILNFAQTGSSYIPGLGFLMLGLCFITAPSETKKQFWMNGFAGGASLAVAVGFWFLFIWALPAAILMPVILNGATRERMKFAVASALSFSMCVGAFYSVALAILHITTLAGLKAWILDAGHGINIRGMLRMILGIARSFINMGNDGMLMKRFLIGDAYNPVTVWQLARLSLWKLALFYVFLASVLWLLWKAERKYRFLLLMAAALPVLGFAYFFGPGDIERYLALYPFLFLLVAYAVEHSTASVWVKAIPCIFLMAVVVTNGLAMFRPNLAYQQEKIAARLGDLPLKMPRGSELVAVNWQDDLVNFYRSFPFHPLNQRESYVVAALVTPGVEDAKVWREDFAKRALRIWASNGELWLSNRAFSQRPAADWNWVEGDDKNVSWKEFPDFFVNIKVGESSGGSDGFSLVPPTEENKQFLQKQVGYGKQNLSQNLSQNPK